MRAEEKEIDGPELEQAEERKRENELIEEKEDEVHDLDGKPYELEGQRDKERSGVIAGAMRQILEGETIVINDLKLPQRELKALEALQTAKRGRDGQFDKFVYAEDRRTLLEQALGVLQPDLVNLERDAAKAFEDLMKDVSGLREHLNVLEDSEDEDVVLRHPENAKTETDTDDKPTPQDDDMSLTGPERKLEKKKSALDGPEPKVEKPKSSLSEGPEAKTEKKKSTLTEGGDVKVTEAKEAKKPETTLGDAAEIAEVQKKKPWWRRPFGG